MVRRSISRFEGKGPRWKRRIASGGEQGSPCRQAPFPVLLLRQLASETQRRRYCRAIQAANRPPEALRATERFEHGPGRVCGQVHARRKTSFAHAAGWG